jgi:phage tail sheath protein FI
MVCCPDLMAAYQAGLITREGVKAVQLAMIAHCERMGDRLAILDSLPDLAPQQVKVWREAEVAYDSKFAALYYPWIKISGPDGRPLAVPPSGHIAGIYARNDNERGVHKAPANEVVRGALEGVIQVTKGEQDTLNPSGVNCIRSFTGRGLRVWGARTLSSDPAWRYVNVRRLFNYIEKSIERGTQWVVFEPNDVDLWARVKRDITAFLTGVWRDGMLFGRSPEEAFFVKCDEEINPPDVRDRGMLFIDIGLAPVKPAEFVVFRLRQWAGGGA